MGLKGCDASMGKRKRTRREYDEDLFKGTTMTFGEHLEELRMCLFKALFGLVVGFLIGLALAGPVLRLVEWPLKVALRTYYQTQAEKNLKKTLEELRRVGYPLPEDPDELEDFLAAMKLEDGTQLSQLKFEKVYVNPAELLLRLKSAYPEQFQRVPVPEGNPEAQPDKKGLVPLFIWRPIETDVRVTSLGVPEPFAMYIKAAFVVGLLISSPWVFYQIWSFVAAGLYPHEKRYVHMFVPFSVGLFLAGAALAFLFVFPPVLGFLFYFNDKLGIVQDIRITDWLGFVLIMPLGFGIAFQLPLVMLFLERIGIFRVESYLSRWRIAILVIFTLAMILTPSGDPYSMLLMAIPLTVLYFGGVLLCKYLPRPSSPFDELED
jgi:sec-independent protein translocase protein TatC